MKRTEGGFAVFEEFTQRSFLTRKKLIRQTCVKNDTCPMKWKLVLCDMS